VPQSFIDLEMEKDPVGGAAEYLAEFRTDIEAIFCDRFQLPCSATSAASPNFAILVWRRNRIESGATRLSSAEPNIGGAGSGVSTLGTELTGVLFHLSPPGSGRSSQHPQEGHEIFLFLIV
jgi:hypothetical protein